MKNIKLRLSLLALPVCLLFASCGEDFLYISPQGSVDEEALTNAMGVELLVVNSYANLTENNWGASPFNWVFGGVYGGDANKGSDPGDQSVLNELEMYNTLNTNGYLSDKYGWTYKGTQRVNRALKVMAKVEDMSASLKDIRKGELLFLRSMFYFEAVKVFGPYLPWVDETIEENDPKVHNDIDIYPKILAEIDEAISLLPNTQSEVGRANVWAAKALKAKILLQKGDMSAAKPILLDVISNGVTSNGIKYALEDDLNANFDTFRENGKESIFAVQFSNDDQNNGNSGMSLCYPHNGGPGGCCGFYQPSFELANSFQVDEQGLPYLNHEYRTKPSVSYMNADGDIKNNLEVPVDPRLDFAIGRIGMPYKDWGPAIQGWVRNAANGGIFLPKKHVFSKAEEDAGYKAIHDGWAPGSAMNLQYLSLRDILLNYAECLANDGELSEAISIVNQIRKRADNVVNKPQIDGVNAANYHIALYPSTHAVFSDKEMAIKAVRFERKLELAMEGHRWFDLTRWGGNIMAAELKDYVEYEKAYIGKFSSASNLSSARTMFPLPHGEVQTMGNDENGNPYLVQPEPWR